jgi:hypothetical protein
MSEIILYVGGIEYLYARVSAFEVDGVTADPTTYAADMAVVPSGTSLDDAAWSSGTWVEIDGADCVRAEVGVLPVLTAGQYAVFVKLTGGTETVIRRAGSLSVRDH